MKKVLIAIVVLIIVMIIGLLSLILLVNPNSYKSMIEKQVAAQTGYTLQLTGDLSWHIWPQISLSTKQVTLSSAGQAKPILSAAAMRLDVALIPLLSHQIIIKQAIIESATVNIGPNIPLPQSQTALKSTTTTTVVNNISSNKAGTPTTDNLASKEKSPWKFELRKVSIVNSTLNLEQASQQDLNFTQINLGIGQSTHGVYAVNFSGNLQRPTQPTINYSLQGTLDLSQLQATQLKLSGTLQQNEQKLVYQLKSVIDLSHYPNSVLFNLAPFSYQITSNNLPALKGSISGKVIYTSKPVASIAATHLQLMVNDDPIQSSVNITLGQTPNIQLQLDANKIDLTPFFITAASATQPEPIKQKSTTTANNSPAMKPVLNTAQPTLTSSMQPNVLSFLTHFNAQLKASIQTLIINKNLTLQQLKLDGANHNGAAWLNVTTQSLGGDIKLDAKANGNVGQGWVKVTPQLSNLQLSEIGHAFAGFPSLSGRINVSGDLLMAPLTPSQLLRSLNGNLKLQTQDLKLNNTNLLQIIQAQLPTSITQNNTAQSTPPQKYTDLGQVTLASQIQEGIFKLTQAEAISPIFKIDASGWLNPVLQNLDISLRVNLLKNSSLKNSFWQQLEGKEIPLKITGQFAQPIYQLEVQKLLQNEVKQQLSKQLDKLKSEGKESGLLSNPKAQKLLNSIFN